MTEESVKVFGRKLKQARDDRGFTQTELAAKAGVSPNHYARLERGEIKPKYEMIEKLAKALNVKSSDILPF